MPKLVFWKKKKQFSMKTKIRSKIPGKSVTTLSQSGRFSIPNILLCYRWRVQLVLAFSGRFCCCCCFQRSKSFSTLFRNSRKNSRYICKILDIFNFTVYTCLSRRDQLTPNWLKIFLNGASIQKQRLNTRPRWEVESLRRMHWVWE